MDMAGKKRQQDLKAKIGADHPFYVIIDDAYRVFNYDTPSITGVCKSCCMYPEIEADFFNPPVRDLPLHYLQDWYFAAYDPGGIPKRVWGYLLPRVLEVLAVEHDVSTIGLEVSLNRFQTGQRENWNRAEWDVLDRFQTAYLARALSQTHDYLDDVLCMFALAGWPLEDLVTQVMSCPDDVLAQRLWNDWCRGKPSIWVTAFWEGGQNSEVYAFYTSRALYNRMEALALASDTPPDLANKAFSVAAVIGASAT